MTQIIVISVTLSILILMSLIANARFQDHERLPMQFGLKGKVGWSAPRAIALSLTPLLAAITLPIIWLVEPRQGQEHLAEPLFIVAGGLLIFAHAIHLWLIRRHFRK